ncbi:DMT family transporter [Roseiflexus sp.]|uniref:DMT family transporter n=1 Tax=Roseiflexus sp. TaxID=2562120 RepID=UPI00398A605B
MQSSSSPIVLEKQTTFSWGGMGIALLAHTGWGAYPVLARYLQTVSDLPSMALLGVGNLLALAIYLPFVWRHVDKRILRSTLIWGFALVVVLRAITNLLAARFTLAIYIQPITLMTPLFVALLSTGLFREPLPPLTWSAIALSLLGALLMMSDDIGVAGMTFALTPSDWIGIGLAVISALCLAIYMILVPRTVKHAVPGESVLLMQLLALTVTGASVSVLIGEDWTRFATLTPMDWTIFAVFVVGVFLGANLGQIMSLRQLGAPLVSSVMAWRLIATLALAALFLGERLDSWQQILGALIVLATITIYLVRQGQPFIKQTRR